VAERTDAEYLVEMADAYEAHMPMTDMACKAHVVKMRKIALRLSAPPSPSPTQEPSQTVPDNDCVICPKCCHQFRAIPVNVQKQLAQPEQEPVAWRYQDTHGHYRYRGYVAGFDKEYAILKPTPLYAAPLSPSPAQPEPYHVRAWNIAQRAIEALEAECNRLRAATSPSPTLREALRALLGVQGLDAYTDAELEKKADVGGGLRDAYFGSVLAARAALKEQA
jgi:hypothetical protein